MNGKTLCCMLVLAVWSASAQYKIDLSKVEYLKLGNLRPEGKEIRVNNLYMEESGVSLLPVMGEIHYNRMDPRYWRDALSDIEQASLRYVSMGNALCHINENENLLSFQTTQPIAAELEILLKNGERIVWNTDATWISPDKKPVQTVQVKRSPLSYALEEHVATYEVYVPRAKGGEEETRLYIDYRGDVANLYQNGQLIADSFYDGTDWIVSIDRLKEAADVNPLVIRLKGLESADVPIYFEKNVNPADCVQPTLKDIEVKQEYRFHVSCQ